MSKRLFLGLVSGIVFTVGGSVIFGIVAGVMWLNGRTALLTDPTGIMVLPILFGLGYLRGVTLED